MSTEGAQFLHLACQRWGTPFSPLSAKPLTVMCVWLSFRTKETLFVRLTFCVNYKRLSINGDISLSFEFNEGTHALLGLLIEAFSLCETVA